MYEISKTIENKIKDNTNLIVPHMILEKIINDGMISRSSLAKELQVTKTIISKRVNELIADGLLQEVGKGNNSLGKKEILLDLNLKYRNLLVVDFSKNKLTIGVYDMKKGMIYEEAVDMPETEKVRELLETIINTKSNKELIEIVIFSMPTVVDGMKILVEDNEKMVEVFEEMRCWCFENYFKIKLFNDVELEAIAIKNSDDFKKYSNMIIMSGHYGIGGSIVFDSKIFHGDKNFAGELGFLNSRLVDGKLETFEDRCSIKSLMARYNKENDANIDLKKFKQLVKDKDKVIYNYYEAVIMEVAEVIYNVRCVIDIENYILTGDLFNLRSDFREKIEEIIQEIAIVDKPLNISFAQSETNSLKGAKIMGISYLVDSYLNRM